MAEVTPLLDLAPAAPARRRPLVAIAAICVVALGVGGFFAFGGSGQESSDGTTIEVVRDDGNDEAYSFATATSTVDLAPAMVMKVESSTFGTAMQMTATIDRASKRMSVATNGDATTGDAAFSMIIDEQNATVYWSGDERAFGLDVETEWVSMDGAGWFDSTGATMWFSDPLDTVGTFAGLAPTEVGLEEIDGETMMHYVVTVSVAELLAEQGLDTDLVAGAPGLEAINYDIWVDELSRLRRMSFDIGVLGESMSMELSIVHLDEPVEITLPDPADVTSMTDLFGSNSGWGDIGELGD